MPAGGGFYLIASQVESPVSRRSRSPVVAMMLASAAAAAMLVVVVALLLALIRVIFLGVRFVVRATQRALAD